MQYNKNPISLREGHALIDGVEVMDGVKMTINFTPETWTCLLYTSDAADE